MSERLSHNDDICQSIRQKIFTLSQVPQRSCYLVLNKLEAIMSLRSDFSLGCLQFIISMQVRQLVEFLIFPKSFNVLSFYSKGHYAIRVRLTAQQVGSSKITKGLPTLAEGREARREQGKKASINAVQLYYQTEHFYVTFSQEKVIFNTACVFKIELATSTEHKIYLDFQLVHSSFSKSNNDGVPSTARKSNIVDRRRLYLNRYLNLNTFKRVLFDDIDYFSFTDVYFLSQSMGEKIRIHEYQFHEFQGMALQQRQAMHMLAFQKQMTIGDRRNQELMRIFAMGIQQFYIRMVVQKLIGYRKLCQNYQHFHFFMSSLNNSTGRQKNSIDQFQWIRVQQRLRQSQLMDMYQTDRLSELFMLIYEESHLIIRNIRGIWTKFIQLILAVNFNIMQEMAELDIGKQQKTKALWLTSYSDITPSQLDVRRQHFLQKRQQILKKLDIYEDTDLHHPFLTIQNFIPQPITINQSNQIQSLVIFVHGYQGSSIDLQKARNFMTIYAPNCHGLLIKTIQQEMDEQIQKLGQLVAQQVRLHIANTMNDYKRINFLGYSLGGILARSALKHLQRFRQKMNIFISFASPHAGIRDTANPLVKTGIWFLTNFEKNKNLKQLNCQKDPDNGLISLYSLSQCEGLSWFNRFIAVSSREDNFVPYASSRIEENSLTDITRQICLNMKEKIIRLERVQVWFDFQHDVGALDRMTGRKAHIQFLQNRIFLDSFFSVYAPLF